MPTPGPLEFLVILVILAIFVLPVVALVLYVRGVRSNAQAAAPARDLALDLLRLRLAKGEIDEGEYRRLRSALRGH